MNTSTTTQSSLFDTPRTGSNLPEYSVGDLSKALKKTVEDTFGLVRVRGEISECKRHSSGHIYITLKDDSAILAAVVWRGQAGKLGLAPEIGMEVVCTGRLTTYPGQSKYQMVIEGMGLAGMGALLKMLEERKKKLAAEGLFDPARKQLLPFLPDVIGVVTSPTGAVIRDILHRLEDRFPRRVLVWPVAVQGEGAAEQIASAIRGFNALPEDGTIPRPNVLIVARGGGGVEDLMPFNEESVVRAAAESHIPLISAVGHETDTTLIDFAADVRAPTPTAAAEMAVPVRANLLAQVTENGLRLDQAAGRMLTAYSERISLLARAIGEPSRILEPLMQRLDERAERLTLASTSIIERRLSLVRELGSKLRHPRDVVALATQKLVALEQKRVGAVTRLLDNAAARWRELGASLRHPRAAHDMATQRLAVTTQKLSSLGREFALTRTHRLQSVAAALEHLSPTKVLERGYAVIFDAEGRVVTNQQQLHKDDAVTLRFRDGQRRASVTD